MSIDLTRIDYSKKKDGKIEASKEELDAVKEANRQINEALKKKSQQK